MALGGCFGRKYITLNHTFLSSAVLKFQTAGSVVIILAAWSAILRKQKHRNLHTPYRSHTKPMSDYYYCLCYP